MNTLMPFSLSYFCGILNFSEIIRYRQIILTDQPPNNQNKKEDISQKIITPHLSF